MNYRIVVKESFKIVGFRKRVPVIFEGVNPEIAKMTELLTPEVIRKLKAISNVEPTGIISASTNFSEGRMQGKGELDHYIGVATINNEIAEFDVLNIDPGTWAAFESIGPFPGRIGARANARAFLNRALCAFTAKKLVMPGSTSKPAAAPRFVR